MNLIGLGNALNFVYSPSPRQNRTFVRRTSSMWTNSSRKQIPETVRAAVLGNAGSFIAFCVAAADAELLAPEFGVTPSALMEQLPFEAWLRRGNLEHAKITALPRAFPPKNRRRKAIAQSRRHFGRPLEQLDGLY